MEALLDFANTVIASQTQALRHERILRCEGGIRFLDGSVLEWKRRKIMRLTTTLLGHGSLQNRDLFWTLFGSFFTAEFKYAAGHPLSSRLDKLNNLLAKMSAEVEAICNTGIHVSIVKSECASLDVGQLAILLKGVRDLSHFLQRIDSPITFGTFDPVLEFFERCRMKLID